MLLVLLVGLLAEPAVNAAGQPTQATVLLNELRPGYPKTCEGMPRNGATAQTGLCLLVSQRPKATGEFRIRPYSGKKLADISQEQVVPLNRLLPLAPGEYGIYQANGLDAQNPARIVIQNQRVITVRTATFKFSRSTDPDTHLPRAYKLQREQPGSRFQQPGGCYADFPTDGVHAYLPGNFLIQPPVAGMPVNPKCERGGIAFNSVAGQGYLLRPGRQVPQTAGDESLFVHPNGVSALVSLAPFNHGIVKLGWLKSWSAYRGIPNPKAKTTSALVLHGPSNFTYILPFNARRNAKVCGKSLAQGGLAAANLLTDCTFRHGKLTGFTLRQGSYFTYHNWYGEPGIAAPALNHDVRVSGVSFKLP
jgi:hypothetical protein